MHSRFCGRVLALALASQLWGVGTAVAKPDTALSPALAARLQRVVDQQDIERLIADYSAYLAAKDFVSYGKLFADGALIGPQGQVIASGPEQTAAMVRKFLGDPALILRHLVNATRIDIAPDGSSATAESFLTTIQAQKGQPADIFRIALYKDRFKKVGGVWAFASRQEETSWVLKERQAADTATPPTSPVQSPSASPQTGK